MGRKLGKKDLSIEFLKKRKRIWRLWTVDNHPRTWAEAVANVEKAGLKDYVEMIHENAEDAVKKLCEEGMVFDMIFQDCGKYV